ncbi:MAG: glycosyltransferase [Dermatophilaceae bacterium]
MLSQPGPHATPVLSVVIACYNGGATIGRQLDALASQPCPVPFEVIVADNGSTDNSRVVASGYSGRLTIRVVDASRIRGPAHARNRGVAEARGRWVAFCDADDEVASDWLDNVVAALGSYQFVAGAVEVKRLNEARIVSTRVMEQQNELQSSSTGVALKHAGAGNMAVRRELFMKLDGFDEQLRCLEDADFCWRVQLAGAPLTYYPSMLVHVSLRAGFWANAKQGYQYGVGHARLERRYGKPVVRPNAMAPSTKGVSLASSAARVYRALTVVPTVRGVLWHFAWHAGHRFG